MTTNFLAPFRWLQDERPLDRTYTAVFVRERDPVEVLRRLGSDGGREVSLAELISEADFRTVTGPGGLVGVVAAGDWCVAVEPFGWSAVLDDVLARLSAGSEVVAVTRNDYANDHVAYAVDGTLITGFDPGEPDDRHGADADRLVHLMREVGLPPDAPEDDDTWDARLDDLSQHGLARAFALAAQLTGVTLTADLLDVPLLAGVITDSR